MTARLPSLICIFLLSLVLVQGQQTCLQFYNFTGYDQVFQGRLQLDCVKSIMTVTISAKSGNYVAIGFNSADKPLMSGADFYIGIERCNSTPIVLEQYGPENHFVGSDVQYNIFDVSSSVVNGNSTYTFSRYFNTGDTRDYIIQPGQLSLLWAYRVNAGFGRHVARYVLTELTFLTLSKILSKSLHVLEFD
eukprot:TRINITY_DN4021_c0_g1_i2.p1 TRINITY_DN4021_c0_g1~~TRINITY_DN4021_c0_g1_i2.p1  ORF type:complete len:191 (+),score=39.27 TRINITY_DN4021_c0_g1_i2:39-611(+)